MNFRQLTGFALSGTLLLTLASCSKKSDPKVIDTGKIQSNKNLTPPEKAEQLAKAAEQLVTYQGFAYASEVADIALQLDSSNVRAQFVKAMLGPVMVNEGLAVRVKPLAAKDKESLSRYYKSVADLENEVPNSTYKSFLKNGTEDIRDEKDLQNYIDSLAESFKIIREFAKNNKNSELTVMTADSMYQSMLTRYGKSCINKLNMGQYETTCPTVEALEVKLNRADFEAIQMSASGYEIAVSLSNSYNLNGTIDKALSLKDQTKIDARVVVESLLQNKEFATLRAGNGFSRLKAMGKDAISGMRWVIQNQSSLCKLGQNDPKNRVGMLFNEGLCADNSVNGQKSLAQAEEVLNGKTYQKTVSLRDNLNPHTTTIKPSALIDSPIADLRSVAPTAYDKCGNITSIQDATLSGVLVNADANLILSKQSNCAE